ncbi:MAG: class IV adenylate cyclase [Bacteroidales bacterium]|nr:class IV adenylate cyclase [Bacteroidales bacterium]
MTPYIIEFKARCTNPERIKQILKTVDAQYQGCNNETDSYLKKGSHILKLRESGNIVTIFKYSEEITAGKLCRQVCNSLMKDLLIQTIGLDKVVTKRREIYIIDNVKINIDQVEGLGNFVEIEAESDDENRDATIQTCKFYLSLMGIKQRDIIPFSYGDIVERQAV